MRYLTLVFLSFVLAACTSPPPRTPEPRPSGPSVSYGTRVGAAVRRNIHFSEVVEGNPVAVVQVRLAPDGTILEARLVKSSGVGVWDKAVLEALIKTERFPLDVNGYIPSAMVLHVRPK